MGMLESLEKRRSHYELKKELPVSKEKVIETVTRVTELVPDSFNSRSARVIILFDEKHDDFWNRVIDLFGGKITEKKEKSFRQAAGTILYFYDEDVTRGLQEFKPRYHDNFPKWSREANAMLQFSVWCALQDLDIGCTLQHYNPVIDDMVKELYDVPDSWLMIGQMPFGGIAEPAAPKEGEDITKRVRVIM